jgi:hypothetical protein
MDTQQYAIVFNREALRNFRAECLRRETTPTKELNRLLEEQLAQWTGTGHSDQERGTVPWKDGQNGAC